MSKRLSNGLLIAVMLLLVTPIISSEGVDVANSIPKSTVETTSPIIHVRGGFGIYIDVYGATDQTLVSVTTRGALVLYKYISPLKLSHFYIHLTIFTLHQFELYVSINNQIWSYQCNGLFFIVNDVTPV